MSADLFKAMNISFLGDNTMATRRIFVKQASLTTQALKDITFAILNGCLEKSLLSFKQVLF